MISFLAGNVVRFNLTFRNEVHEYADPSSVTCAVMPKSGSPQALSVNKDSVGHYHADWDSTGSLPGWYFCKVTGSGDLVAATEIYFKLIASQIQ